MGVPVSHKVVQRLYRVWDLPLRRGVQAPRPGGIRQALQAAGERANLVAGLERIGVLQVLGTDFTELVHGGGKAKFIPLLDHARKVVPGWALGPRAETALARTAWRRAKRTLRRLGRTPAAITVHHDQDGVFTGYGWTHTLLVPDRARLSYPLRGPTDNPEMEASFGRFKTESRSLFDAARDLPALAALVARHVAYYNHHWRHSTLENETPWEYV